MSLANKYRPNDFKDLIGNEENIKILTSFVNKEDKPHSYLFYGQRGLGKTTTARIISKLLDCEIIEINNSNNRGIDTIRDDIYKRSETGNLLSDKKNKAFILDEIHQLPALSQDALLKILEEPPKHVYFFLCTTEPQKLKPTIKSRCSQVEFKKIGNRELYPYLIEISKKEGNEISKKVARQIAETSEGHVRDSLLLLEKVMQLESEERQLKIASEKIEDEQSIIDLCRLLISEDNFNLKIKRVLSNLQNQNPESIRKVVINYMQKVMLSEHGNSVKAALIVECLENPVFDYAVLCMNIFRIF